MLDRTSTSYTVLPALRSTPTVISAWTISSSRSWSPRKRARLAARWVRGLVTVKPTTKLATEVFGANGVYVWQELRSLHGVVPPSPLVAAYLNASLEERQEAARVIGVARIWDEQISPLV
jgi:hypothetical protein